MELESFKDIHSAFLDNSAAFDSVAHHMILWKMRLLNVPEWIISFTKALFEERVQFVEAGCSHSSCSSITAVRSGVPQDSILLPTIFCLKCS